MQDLGKNVLNEICDYLLIYESLNLSHTCSFFLKNIDWERIRKRNENFLNLSTKKELIEFEFNNLMSYEQKIDMVCNTSIKIYSEMNIFKYAFIFNYKCDQLVHKIPTNVLYDICFERNYNSCSKNEKILDFDYIVKIFRYLDVTKYPTTELCTANNYPFFRSDEQKKNSKLHNIRYLGNFRNLIARHIKIKGKKNFPVNDINEYSPLLIHMILCENPRWIKYVENPTDEMYVITCQSNHKLMRNVPFDKIQHIKRLVELNNKWNKYFIQ